MPSQDSVDRSQRLPPLRTSPAGAHTAIDPSTPASPGSAASPNCGPTAFAPAAFAASAPDPSRVEQHQHRSDFVLVRDSSGFIDPLRENQRRILRATANRPGKPACYSSPVFPPSPAPGRCVSNRRLRPAHISSSLIALAGSSFSPRATAPAYHSCACFPAGGRFAREPQRLEDENSDQLHVRLR